MSRPQFETRALPLGPSIAPALAVGCPFIVKPASRTPLGTIIIGEVLAETNLPKGAFSILPAHRDGADLFTDPPVPRADRLVGRDAQPDDVDLRIRIPDKVVEPLAQQRPWPVQAGSVDEDDLVATAVHNVGRSFAPTVHVVSALPKTKNGKIMRRVIRAQHLGEPTGDLAALDSQDSLDAIPALQN